VLAAQYESWNLPLAVVTIVPMCLLASVTGLLMRGMPADAQAQTGRVGKVDDQGANYPRFQRGEAAMHQDLVDHHLEKQWRHERHQDAGS
jgi:hypothetical protein